MSVLFLTDDIRLPYRSSETREKRKLGAARGSGITATILFTLLRCLFRPQCPVTRWIAVL